MAAHEGGEVLYVEDSPSVGLATKSVLEECGHRVSHFVSAEEALETFEKNTFDLVLTDILLEGDLSGTGMVREIRHHQDEEKRRIPVVAISAFSDDARRIELFRAGINDYAQKPVLQDELLARVNNLVRTQKLLNKLDCQQKKLEEIALTDQLTGLYNRHFIAEALPKLVSQSRRQQYSLSMVMIDIDHFKKVNDEFGHEVGDKVLSDVSRTLKELARKEDVLGRYGGEEFLLLLVHCDLKQAAAKAELTRQKVDEMRPMGIDISASFGVSCLRDQDNISSLFNRADAAVYRAKELGRNRVELELSRSVEG